MKQPKLFIKKKDHKKKVNKESEKVELKKK